MQISMETIERAASARWETQDMVHDWVGDYGEPGYSLRADADTPMILLGNWNERGRRHPRLFAQLESQGVEFEWADEWTDIDGRAYRTQSDCYGWQPSYVYADEELFVPTDASDLEYVIEDVRNDPSSAINLAQETGEWMAELGFVRCNGRFENGWYPGQTDDPKVILADWSAQYPDHDFVFVIGDIGQFDVKFNLYRRAIETTEDGVS